MAMFSGEGMNEIWLWMKERRRESREESLEAKGRDQNLKMKSLGR